MVEMFFFSRKCCVNCCPWGNKASKSPGITELILINESPAEQSSTWYQPSDVLSVPLSLWWGQNHITSWLCGLWNESGLASTPQQVLLWRIVCMQSTRAEIIDLRLWYSKPLIKLHRITFPVALIWVLELILIIDEGWVSVEIISQI